MVKEVKDPAEEYRVIRNDRELKEKLKMVMEDPEVELDFFKGLYREVPPPETFMKGEPKPLPLRWRVKRRIRSLLLVLLGVVIGFLLHMLIQDMGPEVSDLLDQISYLPYNNPSVLI